MATRPSAVICAIRRGCTPEKVRSGGAFQIGQNFFGVTFGFYVVEDLFNFAVGADHEGCPGDALYFLAVHVFLLDHAEQVRDLLVWISQQRERKAELVLKLFLRSRSVLRNSKQHNAGPFDGGVAVAKTTGFFRAARRIRLGIEIEDDSFAAKVF